VKPTNTADTSQPNHNLYIGALDAGVTEDDLQRLFQRYGCILHIEKKFSPTGTCYAFVSFLTMDMAIKAREAMLDKFIGSTVPKLGYGTQNVSKSLWVGGIGSWTSIDLLRTEFGQFGEIERIDWPDNRDYAFITYTNSADAKEALQVMHGSMHGDPPREIRVDFANLTQIKSRFNYEPYVKLPPRWRMQRGRSKLVSSHRRSGSYEQKRSRTNESCRSPYNADDISSPSSDDAKSEIKKSSKSSRSKRKKHLSPSSKSPVGKKRLRNPSPPTPSAVLSSEPLESVDVFPRHDERTVVLRSQPVPPPPDVCVAATIQQPLTSMPPPTHVDPVTFYSSIPTSFPPPTYQPPHITPQDFYVPHHPVVSNFLPPVLPQVVSYPPALGHGNPYVPVIDTAASHTVVQPAPEPPKMLPVALSRKDNVASRFPKVWSGALVLKNGAFVVNLHLVSGSVILVDSLLGSSSEPGSVSDCPVLKIAQRLRLDQPDKLDELDRRLFQAGRAQCSVLLACAAPAQVDDVANVIQQRPLEQLVSYLSQKQVAAVVPLPAGCAADNGEAKGVLHAFPPCRFASDFLERDAPGLGSNCPANDQLLVIICNGL
jgi:RNA recognition motif-containing protein